MGDWLTVSSLVVLGIILVIAEVIFVPGTTIVGILGFISSAVGVFLGFEYFGTTIGWWIFAGTLISFAVALYFGFKGDTWNKFSLKEVNSGRSYDGYLKDLNVTDKGKALSTLRPIGKVEFNNKVYEARSFGNYIDTGTEIEIVKIEGNKIYVEPLK